MRVIGRAFDAVRGETKQREEVLGALASMGDRPAQAMRTPRRRVRDPLAKLMRRRGWAYKTPRDGLRRRLYCLTIDRWPWWDWGHPLMTLTGSDFGGNWSDPHEGVPTWYYRLGTPKRMWRTGYPRHPLSTFEVITDYDTFRQRTEGLNEDQMYEWSAIYVDGDGQLQLGHRYWGKDFYGLRECETALLRKYLRMWHRHNWFGVRSWIYSQALNAAVHQRKPRACNVTPPKGTGGYSHWHCNEKRRHKGDHRFQSYTWSGGTARVVYDPEDAA